MSNVGCKSIIKLIKLANVLVDIINHDTINFVVCDFGFANFTSDSGRQLVAGLRKPTSTGITVRYAAPEV